MGVWGQRKRLRGRWLWDGVVLHCKLDYTAGSTPLLHRVRDCIEPFSSEKRFRSPPVYHKHITPSSRRNSFASSLPRDED